MHQDQRLEVALLQPPLFKAIFPEEQDAVFNEYMRAISGLSTPMMDLGTEPNHGLLQLAAILIADDVKVDVFDFHVLDVWLRRSQRIINDDDIIEVIRRKNARLWGISSKVVSSNRAMRIAAIIKELHPDARVVMGGVHPTFQAAEVLNQCDAVDAVVRGEADHIITDLWRWARGQKEIFQIEGVSFRRPDGSVAHTEKSLTQVDLDDIPYPAYQLVARETDPLVPRVLTARGCTLRCVFCSSAALFGYKFNSRQPASVVDQIEHLREEYGCEFVCIGDLTFMAHRATGVAVCQEMIRRQTNVFWSAQTTIGRIDAEAASLMARAGCVQVGFGVETGTQFLHDHNNKRIKIGEAVRQFEIVKAAGISVQTYWVFGLPGETIKSSLKSIELLREWIGKELIDAVHITVAVPYPGTPLFDDPESLGVRIVDRDFDNYWSGSASLGIGYPVIESDALSREHIQTFWRLAHAVAGEGLSARGDGGSRLHYIPESNSSNDVPLLDVTLARQRLPVRSTPTKIDRKAANLATSISIKRSREELRSGRSILDE
ncbi:B12-binding domain-containing radical SAM protein [Actinoplanes xinjiangensis]|uniref:B12-binding domain-containing radical SAM protein n=1 Tax=Actinoplanes xinjiangensis TaxID=512350 RepID=UPI003447DADF